MASKKEYRRLPGRGRKLSVLVALRSRMYAGSDHLLRVDTNGWVENYRRYYFGDIRSLVITKTKGAFVLNLSLLAMIALASIYPAMEWRDLAQPGPITLLVLAAVLLLALVANLLLGPTCRTTIQTAVSNEPLPSLQRWRKAQKFLRIVQPLIEGAQGRIDPAEIPARIAGLVPSATAPRAASSAEPRHAGYHGSMHFCTFALAFTGGLLALVDATLLNPAIALGSLCAIAFAAVFAIMAIVRQHESNTSAALRRTTWGLIAWEALYFFGCYILLVVVTVQYPLLAGNQWALLKKMSSAAGKFYTGFDLANAAIGILLGLLGFAFTLALRQKPAAS